MLHVDCSQIYGFFKTFLFLFIYIPSLVTSPVLEGKERKGEQLK